MQSTPPQVSRQHPQVRSAVIWRWTAAGAAVLIAAGIAGVTAWNLKPSPPTGTQAATRFVVVPSPTEQFASEGHLPALALSPTGKQLVYAASRGGTKQLYVRAMDSLEGKAIPGTQGASAPFFSPDGQWVGFFAEGKLKKVALTGGSPVNLCDAPSGRGGSWAPNDIIFFAPDPIAGLYQVSAKGGTSLPLTKLDRQKGEVSHRWPQVLPGGKAVLFTVWMGPGQDEQQVQLQMLASGERRVLIQGGRLGRYVSTGNLVYLEGGSLLAVPFDLARLEVTANAPMPTGESVWDETGDEAAYALSDTGSLAYVTGGAGEHEGRSLVWVDRTGKIEPLAASFGNYSSPRLSPNGQQVALFSVGAKIDVWLYSLTRSTSSRLGADGSSQTPIWTPDGKRLTYRATRGGTRNIFWRAADGSGTEERLTTGEGLQTPGSWSPDGQVLAYSDSGPTTAIGIWTLRLTDRKAQAFLQTRFNEEAPAFSPDGHSLAYASNESGRFEVYVQPYPGPGGKWQVSTGGGNEPVWNRNGRELFYRSDDKMMAAEVTTRPSFSAVKPRMLFQRPRWNMSIISGMPSYDVSPDGQRFIILIPGDQESAPAQLNVVQNWFEELKRKVPTGTK